MAQAPRGPEWLHELKHDGYRLLALKRGTEVRLWSRQVRDFTEHFVHIAAAIRALPVSSAFVDGEAVILRPDGHCDFNGLRSRAGGAQALMVAFDLLSLAECDLRKHPLKTRREQFCELVDGRHPGIVFSQEIEGDGPTVFEHACRLGAEGIISKRRSSPYRSGRVDAWRKIKFAGFVRR
jgi:bifunctional non-homologous end joining protein LigD